MKIIPALLATSAVLASTTAIADSHKDEPLYKWIGGYAIHHEINWDKPEKPFGYLKHGQGFGLEAGWQFTPDWGFRAEFARLAVDAIKDAPIGQGDQNGNLYGFDALRFLGEGKTYLFSGPKILELETQDYLMLNVGIGRHWKVNEQARFITEFASYFDFDNGTNDYSIKIGFAFDFSHLGSSKSSASSNAASANASMDQDNDGVKDSADRCPGTAAGAKVDYNGCTMAAASTAGNQQAENDSDKDGVVDSVDKCPNTPSMDMVDARGCTRFGEEVVSKTVRVLFANNSDAVENPSDSDIVELAKLLKRYGKMDVVIEGHASTPGNEDYNMALSERRAKAFKAVLVDMYDISASRLNTVGYGETRLLDSSDTAAAHRLNRRIVVNISDTIKVKLTK